MLVLVTSWSLSKEQRRKTLLNNIPENQPESTSTLAKWNTIMFTVLNLVEEFIRCKAVNTYWLEKIHDWFYLVKYLTFSNTGTLYMTEIWSKHKIFLDNKTRIGIDCWYSSNCQYIWWMSSIMTMTLLPYVLG